MREFNEIYERIISLPNLYKAYLDARNSRKKSKDCIEFEKNLHENLWKMHEELFLQNYRFLPYKMFYVKDYKRRKILAPCFRDHIVHHAIFNFIEQIFEPSFIPDSYACRKGKGTHRAFKRLKGMINKSSFNDYFMKCDITKYFYSIDQYVLIGLIEKRISDCRLTKLIINIIQMHKEQHSLGHVANPYHPEKRKGIPIGSLLSQLFANIYLNELDYFVKNKLRIKKYVRYVDDFVIVGGSNANLIDIYSKMTLFLQEVLFLKLEMRKTQINKISFGIDFLGYVGFKHHVRIRSKNYRMFKKKFSRRIKKVLNREIEFYSLKCSYDSYLGHLSYTNSRRIEENLKSRYNDAKAKLLQKISI